MTYLVKAVRPLGTSAFACSSPRTALKQVLYFEQAGRAAITVTAPDGTALSREALIALAAVDERTEATHALAAA